MAPLKAAAMPKSVRKIAVLDRTKEPGAAGEPLYLAGGYIARTISATGAPDVEFASWALTADYTVAPGLVTYAEYTSYDWDFGPGSNFQQGVFIAGVNVSF